MWNIPNFLSSVYNIDDAYKFCSVSFFKWTITVFYNIDVWNENVKPHWTLTVILTEIYPLNLHLPAAGWGFIIEFGFLSFSAATDVYCKISPECYATLPGQCQTADRHRLRESGKYTIAFSSQVPQELMETTAEAGDWILHIHSSGDQKHVNDSVALYLDVMSSCSLFSIST